MSFEATALVLAWGAIAVLAFGMAGILRQVKMLTELIGGHAPPAAGPQRGELVPAELLDGASVNGSHVAPLLVFMDGDCPACAALVPEIARLEERGISVRLVFRGGAKPFGGAQLEALEGMSESFDRLGVPATPYGVLVGQGGTVADALPIGSPEILRRFVESEENQNGLN